MRVVYAGAYDAAGQRFNGVVIHRALLRMGHESDYAVAEKSLDDPRIHRIGSPLLHRLNRLAQSAEKRLGRQSDLALLGLSLVRQPYFRRADLVHLQLLHSRSVFSLRHLPAIAAGTRPVVWTLHDPWITTGHCVHSMGCERWRTGCGSCPDLTLPLKIERDRTAANWRLKQSILRRSRIHLVIASQWMERRAAESPILAHMPRTVIPFGLDPQVFCANDKRACRQKLGIPPGARVAAVRWTPHYELKGTRYAEEALRRLPTGTITHVICFDTDGGPDLDNLRGRYGVVTVNTHNDPAAIATALNAADCFLMPSLGETFGMMAIEAMACGTPPIVFEGTSLPEVVDAPRGGIAVPREDAAALAEAVASVMRDEGRRRALVSHGLLMAAREYAESVYVGRHLALYEELIDRRRSAA
jgi:glycosyltransferase involved in cell wall biosynthesis